MEFHKSLYKSNNNIILKESPKSRIQQNLQFGKARRNNAFQENRIISDSPIQDTSINLENEKVLANDNVNIINKENLESHSLNKLKSRKEQYLARFIEWKKKKELEKNKQNDRRPFVSACPSNVMFEQKSFAPKNHKFKAPDKLKLPTSIDRYEIRNMEKSEPAKDFIAINKSLAGTPKLKKASTPISKQNKIGEPKNLLKTRSAFENKAVQPVLEYKTNMNSKVEGKVIRQNSKQVTNAKPTELKNETKQKGAKTQIQIKKSEKVSKSIKSNFEIKNIKNSSFIETKKTSKNTENAKVNLQKVEKSEKIVTIKTPIKVGCRVLKKPVQKTPFKNTAYLTRGNRLDHAKNSLTKQNIQVAKTIKAAPKNAKFSKPKLIVKKEIATENLKIPEASFITSTRKKEHHNEVKPLIPTSKDETLISPIETDAPDKFEVPLVRISMGINATPMAAPEKRININKVENKVKFSKPKSSVKKENVNENLKVSDASFITSTQRKGHHNEAKSLIPSGKNESVIRPVEIDSPDKFEVPLVRISMGINSTPMIDTEKRKISDKVENDLIQNLNKTPVNKLINEGDKREVYLSPYITLSRGKCNSKTERKLRESMYETVGGEPSEICEMRGTVKYYRKMLSEETERLHRRCEDWKNYVKETDPIILEECGNDMINVAIGQTKLLTSKKFQQFKNLIDQCEKSVRAKYNLGEVTDENQKLILPKDLEGFWQMMYIQVDDIDERFRRLENWKNNNWKDPDEIILPEKSKKKNKLLTKVTKSKKSQPNSEIQGKLRNMKAFMQSRRQELKKLNDDCIILTPSKRKTRRSSIINPNIENDLNDTPIRRSKRLSKTPEIARESTPSRKSLRIEKAINDANAKTPNRRMSQFHLHNVMKTPCIMCPENNLNTTPKPRKSILKTPGTQKKRQTVVFNNQLQFKSPEKLFDSGKRKRKSLSEGSKPKERKRSLNLRARRLIVDPDAKIEIPRQ